MIEAIAQRFANAAEIVQCRRPLRLQSPELFDSLQLWSQVSPNDANQCTNEAAEGCKDQIGSGYTKKFGRGKWLRLLTQGELSFIGAWSKISQFCADCQIQLRVQDS